MEIVVLVGLALGAFLISRLQDNAKPADRPPPVDDLPSKPIIKAAPQTKRFDPTSATVTHSEVTGTAYVVDGDTLRIGKKQIRLFGIDAPELDHPFGQKAKWALVRLCKGQTVRAEIRERDAHDRTVAKCFLPDGRDLSAEMVKMGLAIDWPKFSGGTYSHLEQPGVRKSLWLADARQKGRIDAWKSFEMRKMKEKGPIS